MKTEVVSRHVFRRTARKQERKLERERLQQLVDASASLYDVTVLRQARYRVSKRRGGMRWVVERVAP
jgi:hypothetical protein